MAKLTRAQAHPGYVPNVKPVPDCECRGPSHWCAKHQSQAARDAGRAAQEREAATRNSTRK